VVLPAVTRLLNHQRPLLMLVKPQFELQPGQIGSPCENRRCSDVA
jgi:predicted rRNA methylase YqxC with S4 and FtsJ domains